jgi:hypothetical protein
MYLWLSQRVCSVRYSHFALLLARIVLFETYLHKVCIRNNTMSLLTARTEYTFLQSRSRVYIAIGSLKHNTGSIASKQRMYQTLSGFILACFRPLNSFAARLCGTFPEKGMFRECATSSQVHVPRSHRKRYTSSWKLEEDGAELADARTDAR